MTIKRKRHGTIFDNRTPAEIYYEERARQFSEAGYEYDPDEEEPEYIDFDERPNIDDEVNAIAEAQNHGDEGNNGYGRG